MGNVGLHQGMLGDLNMRKSLNLLNLILSAVIATVLIGTNAVGAESNAEKADAKKQNVDPSGTWRWERERDGEMRKSSLDVTLKEGGKVEGILNVFSQDLESKEGTVDGDKLSLKFEGDRDGTAFVIELVGTIKGDEVTGTIKASWEDESREFPWNANRSIQLSDLAGKWDLRIETSDGDIYTPTLEITKEGDKVEAVYTWEDQKVPAKELKLQDNYLMFTVVVDEDGQELKADFKGRPSGNKISGKADYELGDDIGTVDFTATRSIQLSDLIGKWDLHIETPDGDIFTPTLEITKEGDKVEAVYTWDDQKVPVKELKLQDNHLVFTVVVEGDGRKLKADYKGLPSGNKISGKIDYELGDDTGTVDFTGKRASQK
jgi:hypothetical protein